MISLSMSNYQSLVCEFTVKKMCISELCDFYSLAYYIDLPYFLKCKVVSLSL